MFSLKQEAATARKTALLEAKRKATGCAKELATTKTSLDRVTVLFTKYRSRASQRVPVLAPFFYL